jgi:DNA-directed RNA polymerase subunit RPC12/RpoP
MDGKELPPNDKDILEQDFELEITFVGTADEVKEQMEICQACGSRLILKHFSDFTNLVMQEKAKCMECGTRVRNALYQMQ